MDDKINGQKGKFSSVNGDYVWMILTFVYIFLLLKTITILMGVLFNPFNFISRSLISVILDSIFVEIILAIFLTFIIHKSLLKTLAGFFIFILLFFIYVIFSTWGDSESFSYGVLAVIAYLALGTAILFLGGFALRFIINVQSKLLKIILLILPFFMVILTITIILIQTQNPDINFCKRGSTSKQIDCFYELAIKENNFGLCFMVDQNSKCFTEITNKLNPIKIDPKECDVSEGHLRDVCYREIANLVRDIKICDNIVGKDMLKNCKVDLSTMNP